MLKFTPYRSGSKGNLYTLNDGESTLLLEAGVNMKEIRRLVDVDFDSCLLTHEHSDHSKGIVSIQKIGIDCYMSAGTASALGIESHHRTKIIKSRQQFTVDGFTVLPFNTVHDAKEPLGFLISNKQGEACLFLTDTCYVEYTFPGVQIMAVECSYCDDIIKKTPSGHRGRVIDTHMSLNNLLKLLSANNLNKLKKIFLIHLSDDNSDEARMVSEVSKLTGVEVEAV